MVNTLLCPVCGWTGTEAELDGAGKCPTCDERIER